MNDPNDYQREFARRRDEYIQAEKEAKRRARISWWNASIDARTGEPIELMEPVNRAGQSAVKLAPGEAVPKETCATCGRPTLPCYHGSWRRKRVFCCELCRRKWMRSRGHEKSAEAKLNRQKIECVECKEPFMPKRSDARFCSNKCRQAGFRGKRNG